MDITKIERIQQICKEFLRVHKECLAWASRRAELAPGTSRAKVTTINAKWAQKAEGRDRLYDTLCREMQGDKKESPAAWQPIETAPRDGTRILAYRALGEACWIVCWDEKIKGWRLPGTINSVNPDFWQPLPAPPASNAREEG